MPIPATTLLMMNLKCTMIKIFSVKQHGHQWNDQRPEMNQFSNQNISIPDKDPNNMPYLLPPPPPPPQSQVQMNLQRFNQPNGGNQFDNPAMYQNFQPNIMNMAPPTMVPSPGQMIPGGNQGQIMVGGNQGQMIPSMVPPPSIPPNRSQQAVMHGSSQQMSYPYWMNH